MNIENVVESWSMNDLETIRDGLKAELEIIEKAIEIAYKRDGITPKTNIVDILNDKVKIKPGRMEEEILKISGDFLAKDVPAFFRKTFSPNAVFSENTLNAVLNRMINEGKLRYVRERSGQSPALYQVVK